MVAVPRGHADELHAAHADLHRKEAAVRKVNLALKEAVQGERAGGEWRLILRLMDIVRAAYEADGAPWWSAQYDALNAEVEQVVPAWFRAKVKKESDE